MLSRVADSLYWLSRSIERAENLTRLVDVNLYDALDSVDGTAGDESMDDVWKSVLYATSTDELYEEACKANEANRDCGHFITFSKENPDSIRNSIARARENARMVRDQISEDMWRDLNRIHLFLQSQDSVNLWRDQPEKFYRRVIEFCLHFEGLVHSTILHDEGWQFILLGKYLERADKTSRILDMLTWFGDPDRARLASVLRSCSGFSAFRSEFRGEVNLQNVTSFLLFSQTFPRSVRFCMHQVDNRLHTITGRPVGTFSNEGERLTGSTLAQLNFSSTDNVHQIGLHEYIDDLQRQFNDIGLQLFETYVFLPSEVRNVVQSGFQVLQSGQQQQ